VDWEDGPVTLPPLTRRLTDGTPLIGILTTLDSPEAAEALALSGVDWLFVDAEHSPGLDPGAVLRIAQAVAGRCYTVARVPGNDDGWIKKVLDAGVDGVIVPHVGSRADARHAVAAAKYPPLGRRSAGLARAHGYGADVPGYLARANETTALVVQIEDVDGVANAAEIISEPGVDAVLIGPYDLSGSMGRPGRVDDPEVRAAIDGVVARCRAAGTPVGIFAATPGAARAELDRGITFLAVGTELSLLSAAIRRMLADLGR
jgi:2-keto-3-deoxy-L-rhamnonate aldolase RhmA